MPAEAVQQVPPFPTEVVDFGWVIDYKYQFLRQAYAHFQVYGLGAQRDAFAAFCEEQAAWLDDYALFMALKNHHVEHEGGVWNTWPAEIAHREPEAMADWSEMLADEVRAYKFWQFLFFNQWLALKAYANERGIQIVGDIPIFVAFDSADVWANPDVFYLE